MPTKEWRRKNPERAKEMSTRGSRVRREKHPEKVKAERAAWVAKNPEKERKHKRDAQRRRRLDPDKVAIDNQRKKEIKRKNPEKVLAQARDSARRSRKSNPERYMVSRTKTRCKRVGMDNNLEPSDIIIPKTCPALGIPLFFSNKVTNNTPTIDRIDNSKGYLKDNVVVVSWRANRLKSNATLSELEALAKFYGQWKAGL